MDIEGVYGEDPTEQEEPSGGIRGQTKPCTKCGETKKLSEFNKVKGGKHGVRGDCKVCTKAYGAANKERYSATQAAWYKKNKERQAASTAAWKKANPEKIKAYAQRRRAKKRNAQGTFTADDWKQRLAYHSYRCVYCGVEKHETPEGWLEADHMIPLAKGGTNWPSNLAPACKSCNCSKGTKTYFEFIEYMREKNSE